jgi:hypothetical protein
LGERVMDRKDGKKLLQKMILVRISEEDWERIKKEADSKSVGVSTLSRIWIMEGLGKLRNGAPANKRYI